MSTSQPIIDVTPIDYSSSQNAQGSRYAHGGSNGSAGFQHARRSSNSTSYQQPSWRYASTFRTANDSAPHSPYGAPSPSYTADAASKTGGSVVGGLAQIAVGAGLVMIGIPMLILPGPGLLSIAGGVALAANGTRKLFS